MNTRELKIMDLGRYLVGQDPSSKIGMRMIYNPEQIGRNILGLCACSLAEKNARRIARILAVEY